MGDALTDVDLREAVSFHKEKGALATLALARIEDHSGVVAVGDGCRVSDGATVKRSVLLPGSSVGSGAYLEDCIVGLGYEVRAGEVIRGGALVRGAR